MRFYAPDGVKTDEVGQPQVYAEGRLVPYGMVRVEGHFFYLENHRRARITYEDPSGLMRQARMATAIDEMREALK